MDARKEIESGAREAIRQGNAFLCICRDGDEFVSAPVVPDDEAARRYTRRMESEYGYKVESRLPTVEDGEVVLGMAFDFSEDK